MPHTRSNSVWRGVALALCAALTAPASANAAIQTTLPPLIPRTTFFGDPRGTNASRSTPILSQDATQMMFAAGINGQPQLFVAPTANPSAAKQVTNLPKGFKGGMLMWAHTGQHILYIADTDGDEDSKIHVLDVATGNVRVLTPIPFAGAFVSELNPRFPNEALIAISDRDPSVRDYYRLNILTGKPTLVFQNTRGFRSVAFDETWTPRLAIRFAEESLQLWQRNADGKSWAKIMETEYGKGDLYPGLVRGNKAVLYAALDRNTNGVYDLDLTTRATKLLFADDRADVDIEDADAILLDPATGRVQAVRTVYERGAWAVLDPAFKPDFDYLQSLSEGDLGIATQPLSSPKWVVVYAYDDRAPDVYLYDRAARKATFLWTLNDNLKGLTLAKMRPLHIKTRDGLSLLSYLTLPPGSDANNDGKPDKPLPLVLNVHGGPIARDVWGYDPEGQWLANRGYAVLQVNFRISNGLGSAFVKAGFGQWGKAMHTDLLDGVAWAVQNGIADPKRVAIYGASYGGYATLWGITNSADVFACAIAIVGPSNLTTFIENIPRTWPEDFWAAALGEWRTEAGRAELLKYSPVTHADKVRDPLLIVQGETDPRVVKTESDQMVNAMLAAKVPVTYALYPDEGHGISKPFNRPGHYAMLEAFLAQPNCLGGRAEPIGNAFDGSSVTLPAGGDLIPGVAEAVKNRKP